MRAGLVVERAHSQRELVADSLARAPAAAAGGCLTSAVFWRVPPCTTVGTGVRDHRHPHRGLCRVTMFFSSFLAEAAPWSWNEDPHRLRATSLRLPGSAYSSRRHGGPPRAPTLPAAALRASRALRPPRPPAPAVRWALRSATGPSTEGALLPTWAPTMGGARPPVRRGAHRCRRQPRRLSAGTQLQQATQQPPRRNQQPAWARRGAPQQGLCLQCHPEQDRHSAPSWPWR